MPVTAKLSRRFYEALGDDVANELVEWFNAVDLTYRTELRELNELNHGRFMAKLDQGLATLRAELTTEFVGRLAQLRVDLTTEFVGRLAQLRVDLTTELGGGITGLEVRVERKLAEQQVSLEAMGSRLRTEMAVLRADLIKWMFLFWLGTVAATLASRLL